MNAHYEALAMLADDRTVIAFPATVDGVSTVWVVGFRLGRLERAFAAHEDHAVRVGFAIGLLDEVRAAAAEKRGVVLR